MPGLSSGIIGLPNAGKSTLFNALTHGAAEVAAYPFCTIDPNVGVVPVIDKRLDNIAELVNVQTIIYPTVEFVDVAGLVKDASKGAGRGNEFLDHVRNCDALLQVVRCFEDPNVSHVEGRLAPVEDMQTVNTELLLADLQTLDRAIQRIGKQARHDPSLRGSMEFLNSVHAHLDQGSPLRTMNIKEKDHDALREIRLLTDKRVLYVANIGEDALSGPEQESLSQMRALAQTEGRAVIPICAKLEQELAGLDPAEAEPFMNEMGLKESGLQRLARETARLLGLISFFTFNENEARAWTVPEGTRAQDAAGMIHTDFAEHFIRAEVTSYDDFVSAGGPHKAREKGLTRIEGRDHVVNDADVIYFRVGK